MKKGMIGIGILLFAILLQLWLIGWSGEVIPNAIKAVLRAIVELV